MKPISKLTAGVDTPEFVDLLSLFNAAIREKGAEHMQQTLFAPGNLAQFYHSMNPDDRKPVRYLESEAA
jgi:hypothetical protein